MKTKIMLTILFIAMLLGCQQAMEPEKTQEPMQQPECTTNEDCVPAEPIVGAQFVCEEGKCVQKPFGNPASMKCEEDGGTLEIKEDEEGNQYGLCTLPDGTQCEEWAYYRGECPAAMETVQGECTSEPVHLRAECCQKLLKCDVSEIAVYTSATAQCSCEPTDVQRQCAAVQCGVGKFSVFDPNVGECICVQSGTGEAEAGPQIEMKAITTWQEARDAVMEAFDAKWRKIPGGCGTYEEGKFVPEKITVEEAENGWTAQVYYYCTTTDRPDEPDHKKTVTVTRDGRVSGL